MTTARVIVTRPARDAVQWVQQLQQAGVAAEAFPLIDIAPLSSVASAQALHTAWQAMADYAACLFVSGHAVEQFFKQNTALAQAGWAQAAINNVANPAVLNFPPNVRFMAPGPGTVAALLAAGVPAAQVDAPLPDARQFDSESLWQVIGPRDWQGRRVLIVRGQNVDGPGNSSGRDWIASQWRAAGAQVDFVGAYQRLPPVLSEAQVQRARQAGSDGSVWLFSSSEAIANLLAQCPAQMWDGARAVVTHPRIGKVARAAGFGVVRESRPALPALMASIESLQ